MNTPGPEPSLHLPLLHLPSLNPARLDRNRPGSAQWGRPAGPPDPSIQIDEAPKLIQRVVIAKKLLG